MPVLLAMLVLCDGDRYNACGLQVWSLEALSSRVHMHTGQTRCWERSILCNLPGLYINAPGHTHLDLRPKTTGRVVRMR